MDEGKIQRRRDEDTTYDGALSSSWAMAAVGGPARIVAHVVPRKARRVSHARSRNDRDGSSSILTLTHLNALMLMAGCGGGRGLSLGGGELGVVVVAWPGCCW